MHQFYLERFIILYSHREFLNKNIVYIRLYYIYQLRIHHDPLAYQPPPCSLTITTQNDELFHFFPLELNLRAGIWEELIPVSQRRGEMIQSLVHALHEAMMHRPRHGIRVVGSFPWGCLPYVSIKPALERTFVPGFRASTLRPYPLEPLCAWIPSAPPHYKQLMCLCVCTTLPSPRAPSRISSCPWTQVPAFRDSCKRPGFDAWSDNVWDASNRRGAEERSVKGDAQSIAFDRLREPPNLLQEWQNSKIQWPE